MIFGQTFEQHAAYRYRTRAAFAFPFPIELQDGRLAYGCWVKRVYRDCTKCVVDRTHKALGTEYRNGGHTWADGCDDGWETYPAQFYELKRAPLAFWTKVWFAVFVSIGILSVMSIMQTIAHVVVGFD